MSDVLPRYFNAHTVTEVSSPLLSRRRALWLAGAVVAVASATIWAPAYLATATPPAAMRVLATTSVNATAYLWRPVAIGGGGFITGISADATGATRVARADVYGAYRWLASENRWAQLVTSYSMPAEFHAQNAANEGVYEIVIAPSSPQRIYMVLKGLVFRSDDAGATFVKTSLPGAPLILHPNGDLRGAGPFMAVSPGNKDLVLLGTPERGLWRSDNAGGLWTKVSSVPDGTDQRTGTGMASAGALIWFERARTGYTGRIWVLSPGRGLYVSSDQGKTFSALPNAGTQPVMLRQGDFAPDGTFFGVDADSQSVWRYRSGAWSRLGEATGLSARRYAAVAVNPRTSQVFLFDEGGRAFRSSTGGDSWWPLLHKSRVGESDPPWLHVSNESYFAMGRVHFDPVVADRLWVGAGTGVYFADISENSLQVVWTSHSRGIEELVANDVVKPPGGAPLFAAWDFGIHRKVDLDAFSTGYGPRERVLIAAQQLAMSPSDPLFVVTNASDTRTACCSEDGDAVLAGFSADGGISWKKFATLPTPPGGRDDDPWRMSFGTIAVSANDVNNIVWEPTFHRSPFYTRDRGATWQRVVLPGEVLPFTGSHSALHYHRKTLVADQVTANAFYLYHSGDGMNASLAGLWQTRDGGSRWTRVHQGEIVSNSQHSAKLRAVPGRAGHLFFTAGIYGATDTVLRRSVDGGAHWTPLRSVDQVDDVAFGKSATHGGYPTIFISGRVSGSYGIWRSVDEARSWQAVGRFPVGSLDQVTVMAGDPDIFGRVYLGYLGSGWKYGEPSDCHPGVAPTSSVRDCAPVQ